jgi:hypothetical protein
MTLSYFDYAAGFLAVYFAGRLLSSKKSQGAPFPPGPPGVPIIGNLLDWPTDQEWDTFSKWAQQYGMNTLHSSFSFGSFLTQIVSIGDIVHVNLAGKHVVILSHPSVAQAMLERKGAIYSDRPALPFASMAGFGDTVTLMSESSDSKLQRKVFAQEMGNKNVLGRFTPMTFAQTQKFIRNIVKEPSADKLFQHIRK